MPANYKAAGWIPQEAHQYVREVKIKGRWMSVRDASRHRCLKQATEKKNVCRRKYILPLTPVAAQLIASKSDRVGTAAERQTTGISTENMPSAPLTGTDSVGRTPDSTQAKSPGLAPQQAAASSPATNGRQSTKSATATATPVGSSP